MKSRLVGLGILVIVSGCQTTETVPAPTPEVEASVVFSDQQSGPEQGPGDGLKLVAISQENAVSGNFFGFESGDGSDATITEYSGDTSSSEFVAEVDETLQVERVDVDETALNIDYNEDDTFDYTVDRGDSAHCLVVSVFLDLRISSHLGETSTRRQQKSQTPISQTAQRMKLKH